MTFATLIAISSLGFVKLMFNDYTLCICSLQNEYDLQTYHIYQFPVRPTIVNHLFLGKCGNNLTSDITATAVCKWQEVSELNVDELCRLGPRRLFMGSVHEHGPYNVTQHAEEMPINIH